MNFARKAVQWDQDDVKASASLLRRWAWDIEQACSQCDLASDPKYREHLQQFPAGCLAIQPVVVLLQRLDWDVAAAKSLLIFVNEFRCLIEGVESTEEGSTHAHTESQAL